VATERSAVGGWLLSGRAGPRVLAILLAAASAAFVLPAAPADAKPKETLSQAKAKLQKLNSQVDKLDDQFNKAKEEWKAAKAKLDTLNKSVARDKTTYDQLRARVAQLAAAAYKGGQSGDIPALVSAKDPEAVLDQMSVFTAVSKNRSAEVTQFLATAQMLKRQQAQAQQATDDLTQKKNAVSAQEKKIKKLVADQQKLVSRLGGGTSSSGGGSVGGSYTGPATGSARKALDYAFAQLGKPYVYGGEGPNGFDCSGLTMMAWRAGGVSLPRVVPDQRAATKNVARADLQPGDLVFFAGLSHVGIFVGGSTFLHAPHTGTVVQKASLNNSYYRANFLGGGRP
jgi:peptidoglycan DL-endopeptidase CwlO